MASSKHLKFLSKGLIYSSLLISICSYANTLPSNIQHLLQQYKWPNGEVGIKVSDLSNSDKTLISYNANRLFIPASNMKLLTSMATLTTFGKNYTFDTTISTNQKINKSSVDNLYVDFSGDPSLTTQDIQTLVKSLATQGISHVHGDVYIVGKSISGNKYPVGFSYSDKSYGYGAPASSYNLNENNTEVTLSAMNGSSMPAKAISGNPIKIRDTLTAADPTQLLTCDFVTHMNRHNKLFLSGCLPKQANGMLNEEQVGFATQYPTTMAKKIVRQALKSQQISVLGKFIITNKEPTLLVLLVLASHRSQVLSDLLTHMLKYSDNLYAETFFRSLGYQLFGAGTYSEGVRAVSSILLTSFGINPQSNGMIIEDGAGMSRRDLLSPTLFVQLLTSIHSHNALFNVLYNALPISGSTGTLLLRMTHALKGKVHAKTGTMTNVSTLSGYVTTASDHLLAFSILTNNSGPATDARKLQDAIVTDLYYAY